MRCGPADSAPIQLLSGARSRSTATRLPSWGSCRRNSSSSSARRRCGSRSASPPRRARRAGRWMLVTARMKHGRLHHSGTGRDGYDHGAPDDAVSGFQHGLGSQRRPAAPAGGRACASGRAHACRRGRRRPADCLRQRRQPVARARGVPAPRACRSRGARGGTRPARASASGRESRARGRRRPRGPSSRMVGDRVVSRGGRGRFLAAARARDRARLACRSLHCRTGARDVAPLRARSGPCRLPSGSPELAQGRRPRGRRAWRAAQEPARRGGNRGRARAARRSGAADPKLRPAGRRRPGFRAEHVLSAKISIPTVRYDEPGKDDPVLRRAVRSAWRRSRACERQAACRSYPSPAPRRLPGSRSWGRRSRHSARSRSAKSASPPAITSRRWEFRTSRDDCSTSATRARKRARSSSTRRWRSRYWPNESPLGRRIVVAWNDEGEDEIVGVVGDIRHATLETASRPMIYYPPGRFAYPWIALVLRAEGESGGRRTLSRQDRPRDGSCAPGRKPAADE